MTDTSQAIATPLPINSTTAPVQPAPGSTAAAGSQALTFNQVKNYWIQAGGNPQAADMAAAVADAESGLNPNASRTNPDGTTGVGLWLIPQNGTPPGSTDPVASARAALQLSQNGTDWTQWCSAWSDNNCGQSGGTYLGSGSNALMSLGTQSSPGSYNVFGATPSSTGQGASGTTSASAGTTGGTSGTSRYIMIGAVIVVIMLVVYLSRRKTGGEPSGPGRDLPQMEEPSTQGMHTVRVPAHTRTVPG